MMFVRNGIRQNALFQKVRWCVSNSNSCRCNLSLLDYFYNMQHHSKNRAADCFFPNADKTYLIDDKYYLSNEDRGIAKEILQQYQKYLSELYFSNQSDIMYPSLHKLTEAEYFVLTLKAFLEKHQCEKEFCGHLMYTNTAYKDLGTWGGPLLEATYALTEYAVVYHKMYYIAQIYCLTLSQNPLDTHTASFQMAESTKEVINTKKIEVSNI